MAFRFLNAVTTSGESASIPVRMNPRNHTVQFTLTGGPTAVTLDLEGSLDGVTFTSMVEYVASAEDLTNASGMFHVVDKVVRYVRLNLTLLSGGTTPTVTALYEGETA